MLETWHGTGKWWPNMAVTLDYEKLSSGGHITALWALPNAFANWESPTIAELNAQLNISKAVSWNDFDFGTEASNTVDDPSIADIGNVQDRGAAQYGGGMSFYYPNAYDDNSNVYSLVYDAISEQRTRGYIVLRIDGNKATTTPFAAGDYVHVFEVMTDGETNSITGEEAFRYTLNFLQQGNLAVYTVARSGAATVDVTPSTLAIDIDESIRLDGNVLGREYTNGLSWISSAPAIASVSNAGVVTGESAGSATITATFDATGATDTCAVTVS